MAESKRKIKAAGHLKGNKDIVWRFQEKEKWRQQRRKRKEEKQKYEVIRKLRKERSNMMQSCSCIEDKGKKRPDVN